MGTLALNIQMPFQIMCVQCNLEMKPAKGTKGLPTCPQCGFKVKLVLNAQPKIQGLKAVQPSQFKRPQPLA